MFASSVIRKLSRSEEMFAETHSFVGLAAHVRGPVDVDAISEAFDALLQARPVLGGHLERDVDGRHQIVVDDLVHPGIEVVELAGAADPVPPIRLDQAESLIALRLTIRDGQVQPTLYVHHSLADGHHEFGLIEEVFSYYTDLVTTGSIGAVAVRPAPDSLETVLAERGITKLKRSGLERFMPAMFAYDLPPSRRIAADGKPMAPTLVPMVYFQLDERRTQALIEFARIHRIGVNGLVSAAVLLAEWRLRGTPHIPVPYIYPVDLRYVLSPPVSATGCTNPVGVATYLAEISRNTDLIELARDIGETFRADLADGVIQQSLLHFSPQYVGNPAGLPDVVMLTDNGLVPPMRTPPEVDLVASHGELYFAVNAGIDMYASKIFAGRLMLERHCHAPGRDEAIGATEALLAEFADRHVTAQA